LKFRASYNSEVEVEEEIEREREREREGGCIPDSFSPIITIISSSSSSTMNPSM